jgi:hypothetical protein
MVHTDLEEQFVQFMDKAITHILFSGNYFFDKLAVSDMSDVDYFYDRYEREPTAIYPLFAHELMLWNSMPEPKPRRLLDAYIDVLRLFRRNAAIQYLDNVFDLALSPQPDAAEGAQEGCDIYVKNGDEMKVYNIAKRDEVHDFLKACAKGIAGEYGRCARSPVKVLLLGSYGVASPYGYIAQLRKDFQSPWDKLKTGSELSLLERFILLHDDLVNLGCTVYTGKAERRHVSNVYVRLHQLMEEAHVIVLLYQNEGGVAIEYGTICENDEFRRKTYVLSPVDDRRISGYATYGAFLLPDQTLLRYSDDEELRKMVNEIGFRAVAECARTQA